MFFDFQSLEVSSDDEHNGSVGTIMQKVLNYACVVFECRSDHTRGLALMQLMSLNVGAIIQEVLPFMKSLSLNVGAIIQEVLSLFVSCL